MADFLKHTLGISERVFYGNSVADWVAAGVVAAAVWAGLWIFRRLIAARHTQYSTADHPTPIRVMFYLLGNTKQFLFLAVALDAGRQILTLPADVQHGVSMAVLMLILLQVGLWAARSLRFYLKIKEMERGSDSVLAGSFGIINFVAGILIWSLLILVALENLGVNITALLAGLGVGGVAVALALQNVLSDLFASLPGPTLQEIPKLLQRIVREQPNACFERCHLKSLGDSCLLQFELSYLVQQPKLHSLFDLQQAVNFRILDEFRRLGVNFAYPTQRVLVENQAPVVVEN